MSFQRSNLFKNSNRAYYIWLILSLFLICPDNVLVAGSDPIPFRFGHPFYDPDYVTSPLDGGILYLLSPLKYATCNYEHVGDFTWFNPEFFQPDLVTSGSNVFLSSLYSGPRGTRALWQGRPFRDGRTSRADLSLIPPAYIGGMRTTHWGALNGVIAPGAVVDFLPLRSRNDNPLTYISHCEGFYAFAPVEFMHTRRIGTGTYVTAGGLIPSSRGRWANARHTGHILYAGVETMLDSLNRLDFNYMSNLNRHEIPFTETSDKIRRGDLDVSLERKISDASNLNLSFYRTESDIRLDTLKNYSRELGMGLRFTHRTIGGNLRLSHLDGELPGGAEYDLKEFEGTLGMRLDLDGLKIWLLGGGYGWLPDRVKPVASSSIEYSAAKIGDLFIELKQSVDPHSPEMMYAVYDTSRPRDEFEPAWNLDTGLPVMGADKPPTIHRGGRVGIRRIIPYGEVETAFFGGYDVHPVVWSVVPDSAISLASLDERYSYGWQTTWRYRQEPYRALLSFVGMNLREESNVFVPVELREPGLRILFETGWHRSFWNDEFEADISLSGKYYGRFSAYGPNGWEKLGPAYPLDFRATFRIRHFTFYYGVHNWNSFQYHLVPGYKMIHKEEYWGINWLLFN